MISPSLLSFILTHYVYNPTDHIIWERTVRRGTHFVRVEAQDRDHYWITCQVDYTGVEFSTQVD